jgi:hypothetical protein
MYLIIIYSSEFSLSINYYCSCLVSVDKHTHTHKHPQLQQQHYVIILKNVMLFTDLFIMKFH